MRFLSGCILVLALCGAAAASAAPMAYASNEGSGTVSVIDTATNRVIATIDTGGKPRGIAAA
jgi:YVTN family beta-propeller protein